MEVDNSTPAERHYKSQLKSALKYQKRNPEKIKEITKRYYDRIRGDPEKRAEYLRIRREYYRNVVKPKRNKIDLDNLI